MDDMNSSQYFQRIFLAVYIGILFFILVICNFIFPTATELPLFYYWNYEGIIDGLFQSWPIFLWGFTITLISLLLCKQTVLEKNVLYVQYTYENSTLFKCLIDSLFIGIIEEILYRWLYFYSNIIGSKIFNFFFFDLYRPFYINSEAPWMNWCFFNRIGWLVFDQSHWSIGSGAVLSNGAFRDAHVYLGLFGYYNSWCLGFFLFWIMINYGLPAAILSHTFYDFIIFSMFYIHSYIQSRHSFNYKDKYLTSQSRLFLFSKFQDIL